MQLRLALRTGLLLGTFGASSSSAFLLSSKRNDIRVRIGAKPGQGWENDNYLEALSGGKDALERANNEYYQQSEYQKQQMERLKQSSAAGAAPEQSQPPLSADEQFRLTEELKRKIEEGHEQGPGGSRWKQLLELSQKASPVRPQSIAPPTYVPPVYTPPFPQQPAALNPNELSVEEQARMFREMMQQQQQPQGYMPPPQPQYDPYNVPQQRPSRPDPRPVGRNRDADAISNASDLYLAQLKYDSSVRNIARYRGDENKANAVFADEGVHKLKDELLKNPYLTSPQPAMVGTSLDELLYTQRTLEDERNAGQQVDVTTSGVSYKEKLRQRQQQLQQKQAPQAETSAISSTAETKVTPSATAPVQPVASDPTPTTAKSPPKQSEPVTTAAASLPKQQSEPTSTEATVASQLKQNVAFIPTKPSSPATQAPTTTTSSSEADEFRGEIRTLMGLLLKHRGGPGFGAGRLKGPEIARFEQLLSQVTEKLRQETKVENAATIPQSTQTAARTTTPASIPPPPPKQQPVQQQQQPKPQPVVSTSSAISVAETIPGGERVQRMIACLEGAIQMYKNSPPELQEGLLVTMRSALMTAVTTCNQVIAENELRNYETYQALAGSATAATPRATPPSQFFDVVQVDEEDEDEEEAFSLEELDEVTSVASVNFEAAAVTATVAAAELDGNSILLENIYQELKAAAGNGKLGLRPDLSSEEAASLSNSLLDMRAILMEELESGIPRAEKKQPPPATGATVSSDQSSSSNY